MQPAILLLKHYVIHLNGCYITVHNVHCVWTKDIYVKCSGGINTIPVALVCIKLAGLLLFCLISHLLTTERGLLDQEDF